MGGKPKNTEDTPLAPKQALFVLHYLATLNATQAAILSGYSERSARKTAFDMMQKPHVKKTIETEMAKRMKRTAVDADYVLNQAVKLHERCMQEIEPFTDKSGEQIFDSEGRPMFVFNANGAAKALELVGRHVNVQAFKDKVDVATINLTVNQEDAEL